MGTLPTENSLTENEIRNIAYSTYLHRDSVLDEIASIDCYLRTHDRCVIHQSSPVYDIARIVASLDHKSVFYIGTGISLSVYGLASVSSLANKYINTYIYINGISNNRSEFYNLCYSSTDDTKNDKQTERYSDKSVNNHCSTFHSKYSIFRPFILFFRRFTRRFCIHAYNKKK